MGTSLTVVTDKLHQLPDELATLPDQVRRIEIMQAETMKEIRGGDNDTKNLTPSVIVAGGQNTPGWDEQLRSVELFNWSEKTWSTLQPMNTSRAGASSFVYENHVTVTGGETKTWYTNSMERININQLSSSTQWNNFPAKLPGTMHGHRSVVYDGRLIVIGGINKSTACFDSIHEVQLSPRYTTNLLTRMQQSRCCHGVELYNDGILIVGGKKTLNPKDNVDSVLMLDVNKKECKQMAPLPFAVSEMATVRWDDNVIVIGGVDKKGKVLNTVVIYNVQTGMSHMLPNMKSTRRGCAAVVSQNTIVVLGGRDERKNCLNSVECFSFDSYFWEDLPPMVEARERATAVAVAF